MNVSEPISMKERPIESAGLAVDQVADLYESPISLTICWHFFRQRFAAVPIRTNHLYSGPSCRPIYPALSRNHGFIQCQGTIIEGIPLVFLLSAFNFARSVLFGFRFLFCVPTLFLQIACLYRSFCVQIPLLLFSEGLIFWLGGDLIGECWVRIGICSFGWNSGEWKFELKIVWRTHYRACES